MQSVSYQYEDNTLEMKTKQEEVNSVKTLSKEALVEIASSISRDIKEIPAFHLFSSTILQYISTVSLHKFDLMYSIL